MLRDIHYTTHICTDPNIYVRWANVAHDLLLTHLRIDDKKTSKEEKEVRKTKNRASAASHRHSINR